VVQKILIGGTGTGDLETLNFQLSADENSYRATFSGNTYSIYVR
jgi:hypothetical protein